AATLRAPFAGLPYLGSTTSTEGCQVATSVPNAPAMNLSSGRATASVKSHASACASATGRDGAESIAYFGLYTTSFTMSSGPHNITLHWRVTWTATVTARPLPAVAFYPSAETYLTLENYLDDSTNGTFLNPSNGWHASSVTFNGSSTSHHSAAVTIFFNQTLVAGHHYIVYSWLAASTLIFVPDTGRSIAAASLDVATHGNGATLTSIVLR
ncbi:MAG: hypothetical protein L3K05_05215, partial [Thermoplasmata archaeon]|nr:hypothetical protein [Thermoplasmata archaeon]